MNFNYYKIKKISFKKFLYYIILFSSILSLKTNFVLASEYQNCFQQYQNCFQQKKECNQFLSNDKNNINCQYKKENVLNIISKTINKILMYFINFVFILCYCLCGRKDLPRICVALITM
ncbi:hypothetical protein [Candidatus Phytoplasma oryzae]|nr:hypothetical protein PIE28_01865 [Candidatus Phytoplasma oryzae]